MRHLRRLTDSEVIAVVKADGYGHGAVRAAVGGARGRRRQPRSRRHRRGARAAPGAASSRRSSRGCTPPAHPSPRPRRRASSSASRASTSCCRPRPRHPATGRSACTSSSRPGSAATASPPEDCAPWCSPRRRASSASADCASIGAVQPPLQRLGGRGSGRARRVPGRRRGSRHPSVSHRRCATSPRPTRRSPCPRRASAASRIGIGIYGLSPFADRSSARPRPAARDDAARGPSPPSGACRPGQGVSYGYDYRTERETTLALVPLGYADGVPRQASGGGPVIDRRRRFASPGASRWTSSSSTSATIPSRSATRSVLFGDPTLGAPSADEWADAAGTINYEIVTRIGPRVPRRQVSG